jgi:hypothetical protein
MIPIQNKPKDEIANRLTMAIAIMGSHVESDFADHDNQAEDIWGAIQLVQDALYLFEDMHFPGNKALRKRKDKDE